MTGVPGEGMAGGPRTMAAVMAAVQAYMDEEARLHGPPAARKLSAWKRASWRTFRGDSHSRSWSWKTSCSRQ